MPARMTPTAWGQGFKNALICGIGLLVFWCAIAGAVSLILDQSLFDSFGIVFAVLWGLLLLVFLGMWFHGRTSAGHVLLDCGPHPTRNLFLMQVIIFLIIGLTGGLAETSVSKTFGIAGPVFGVSFSGFWLIMATAVFKSGRRVFGSTGVCFHGARSAPIIGRMTPHCW